MVTKIEIANNAHFYRKNWNN